MPLRVRELSTTLGPAGPDPFTLGPVSFDVADGQIAVLTGPIGAGKSLLIESLLGLHPAIGSIILGDDELIDRPVWQRGFGWIPQDGLLLPSRTVRWQLDDAARTENRTGPAVADRDAFLTEWRLTPLLDRRTPELSGGQRQLVAAARAILSRPRMLLLDEPFAALDPAERQRLQTLIVSWIRTHKLPALHVTHSEDEAAAIADVRLRMDRGQLTSHST